MLRGFFGKVASLVGCNITGTAQAMYANNRKKIYVGLPQKRQEMSDELQFVVVGNPRLRPGTMRPTEVRRTFCVSLNMKSTPDIL